MHFHVRPNRKRYMQFIELYIRYLLAESLYNSGREGGMEGGTKRRRETRREWQREREDLTRFVVVIYSMVAICIYSRAYDDVRVPIVYAESLSQADKQRELARPRYTYIYIARR